MNYENNYINEKVSSNQITNFDLSWSVLAMNYENNYINEKVSSNQITNFDLSWNVLKPKIC